MKQSDFLNSLKIYVSKTAGSKNPEITANAIYFMTKQYPVILTNKRVYIKILKEMKTHLIEKFGWSMVETHKCFCILHGLMKIF